MERRSVTLAHHAHVRGSKPLSTIAAIATHNRAEGVAPRHEGLMLLNQDDHDMFWRVAGIEIDASLCRHSPGIGMRRPAEAPLISWCSLLFPRRQVRVGQRSDEGE